MVFFQVLLLGGYAYAHVLTRFHSPRAQAAVHLLVLIAGLSLVPIIPGPQWKPSPAHAAGDPTPRIIALLLACVGLPYFALSATGPLLQAWFARLNPGVSPYRLYAMSNVGSLLALVSYPFIFEPALSRHAQAIAWSLGLCVFAMMCGSCA